MKRITSDWLVVKFVSAAWLQFDNTVYTQNYTVNHGKVDPILFSVETNSILFI